MSLEEEQSVTTYNELWAKLANDKDYRREFVASLLKRGTAMQIRSLLEQREWTQGQLAQRAGLTQGVISRAANPAYGNLTYNTVIDIAAGFDVAFIGRFVPFSELTSWVQRLPEGGIAFEIPSFGEENAANKPTIEGTSQTRQKAQEAFVQMRVSAPASRVSQLQLALPSPEAGKQEQQVPNAQPSALAERITEKVVSIDSNQNFQRGRIASGTRALNKRRERQSRKYASR